jgi:hypothetical protein
VASQVQLIPCRFACDRFNVACRSDHAAALVRVQAVEHLSDTVVVEEFADAVSVAQPDENRGVRGSNRTGATTIDFGEPLRRRGRRDRLGQWHARCRGPLVTLQRTAQLHEGDASSPRICSTHPSCGSRFAVGAVCSAPSDEV